MDQITLEQLSKLCKESDFELRPTHPRLCLPIINRLYKKMTLGIHFPNIRIAGDVLVNGHHRYLASILAKIPIDRSPTILPEANDITNWKSVEFDLEDWDSEAGIRRFIEIDARYNRISIEEIWDRLK